MSLTTRRGILQANDRLTAGSEARLFAEQAARLGAAVQRNVRTSPVNVEDACSFAWLQLLRCRPNAERSFSWLCTTAIREAIKLDRGAGRVVDLDQVDQRLVSDPRQGLDHRLELLATLQAVDDARLRPRERRLVALRALGYNRLDMALLTGQTFRTVDRQLGRAQRKLGAAREHARGGDQRLAREPRRVAGARRADRRGSRAPAGDAGYRLQR